MEKKSAPLQLPNSSSVINNQIWCRLFILMLLLALFPESVLISLLKQRRFFFPTGGNATLKCLEWVRLEFYIGAAVSVYVICNTSRCLFSRSFSSFELETGVCCTNSEFTDVLLFVGFFFPLFYPIYIITLVQQHLTQHYDWLAGRHSSATWQLVVPRQDR